MRILSSILVALLLLPHACGGPTPSPAPSPAPPLVASAAHAAEPAPSTPPSSTFEAPRIAEVRVPGDLSAFVVRGARRHALSVVFLAGMCAHPGGYLASFPWTAVLHGDVVGVQGDLPCGEGDGDARRWSYDLARVDRRIESAFRASDLDVPTDITIVGYSQGAEIAERLAARFPERYRRLVIISSPIHSTAERLGHARGVLFGIGEYESRATTLANVTALERANVPTAWFVLPGAHHGQMGTDAGRVMGDVLSWLEAPEQSEPNSTIRTSPRHNSAARTTDSR